MKKQPTKIVLTGAPGSGKSTSLTPIKEHFEKNGYHVLTVPETATELITSGIAPWTMESYPEFQSLLMDLQMDKEKAFERFVPADRQKKTLILLDRGLLDNKAFMKNEDFARMLEEKGISKKDLMDRYDAVFHMESPARIYPECYTVENNPARKHNAEQSIELDKVLHEIWKEHPQYHYVPAQKDFGVKTDQLITQIENFLKSHSS